MRTPEGYEKDEIKKYLDSLPNCWYFCPFMAGFGQSGVPDIVGCYNGHFFAIEVKRPGKKPTSRQLTRMSEIDARKGWAVAGAANAVIPFLKLLFK